MLAGRGTACRSVRPVRSLPSAALSGSLDGEASRPSGADALPDVVGPGRNAGYWNPVSSGANGRAVVPGLRPPARDGS